MRSTCGCNGNIRASRSNDTLTTRSAIVRAKRRRLSYVRRWNRGLRNAGYGLHPQKTKIVYCKDANRPGEYPEQSFDFLGYTFRPRVAIGRGRKRFVSFIPAVSDKAAKRMRLEVRRWRLHLRSDLELEDIAEWVRPILAGWVRYYGRFYPSKLRDGTPHDRCLHRAMGVSQIQAVPGPHAGGWDWLRSLRAAQPEPVRPLGPGTSGRMMGAG